MGERLPWQLQSLYHSVMASCSYGNPSFLHMDFLLQISSLLSPYVSSHLVAAFLRSAIQFSYSSTQLPCAFGGHMLQVGTLKLIIDQLCRFYYVMPEMPERLFSLSSNSSIFSPSVLTDPCISEGRFYTYIKKEPL